MSALTGRFSRALRDRPFLTVPLFLCLYGFGTIDTTDFFLLSANPAQLNPEVHRQFLQFSPLPYFLGYPLTNTLGPRPSFAIVMLGGLLLFTLSLRRFAATRYGARCNDAILMVFATPLLIVLTQYFGKSDSFLAASFFLLLAARTTPGQLGCAALVVISHFEIGSIILASAVFLSLVRARVLVGGIAGALVLFAYHYLWLPSPPQSRANLGASYLVEAFSIAAATPIAHLVWTFGPFWWCVTRAWPLHWRWAVVFAGALGLATVTLDFTRVFVLVGLPLIVVTIDRVLARLEAPEPRWLTALPYFAYVQAHLLSAHYYDSRISELAARVFGFSSR